MMAGNAEGTYQDIQQSEEFQPYVSCIRIYGQPILPPLMTAKRRDEMRHYKGLAELVEMKLKKKDKSSGGSLTLRCRGEKIASKDISAPTVEPQEMKELTNPVEMDTSLKIVDTHEILEEFDPFAPSSCSMRSSGMKCWKSGSTDEFSTSKTGSSDDSVAMTNSTDLYHYMDVTGSSIGDGRSTRRSFSPTTGGDWNTSPNKMNMSGDDDIKATFEGLNEYLDSILIGSASSPPTRTKSDEDATPTNEHEHAQIICLDEDKRSQSCPLSPIPRDSIPDLACVSLTDKLVDIIGEPTECADSEKPRLVRSNSYTLDAPSPMLLAHLEAEKKKNGTWKPVSKKTDPKEKMVANGRSKMSGAEKRSAGIALKRNESHLSENRATHSPPKKSKSPSCTVAHSLSASSISVSKVNQPKDDPTKSPKMRKELIGQPEVRKLFADLQAEHNRQMEQLVRRQRREQELIREAILGQKVTTRGPNTWAHYLRTNGSEIEKRESQHDVYSACSVLDTTASLSDNCRKSLSSSFILSQISSSEINRNLTLSAPPGSLSSVLVKSPTRPSSSPALTTFSVPPVAREVNRTDTNGNLTNGDLFNQENSSLVISPILPLSHPSRSDNVLLDDGKILVNEVSPRTRRRVWASQQAASQDPDWLQLSRQRQMDWAASKIQAGVRGYLTRRLFRTERVQGCITVIHDTILCALELQKECARNIEPSDLQLHGRLIHQLSDACREIHSIFVEIPVSKRMAIIAMDRERLESRSPRNNGPRPLSRATQIALRRKMAHNNANPGGNAAPTTRRRNWANNIKGKTNTQESCEIVPSCVSRSSTLTSNGDTQRSVSSSSSSGGGSRKPWR